MYTIEYLEIYRLPILYGFIGIWFIAMLRNFEYLRTAKLVMRDKLKALKPKANLPSISIVIPVCEQCEELKRNLTSYMSQDYPASFEVIIVDMNSTDDTKIYLETQEGRYPNLNVTQLPSSIRDISPIRLAITLGFRAANYDWIIITQADCRPTSDSWLLHFGKTIAQSPEANIVLGYTRYAMSKRWSSLRFRFYRIWQQLIHFPYVDRHGAYRADGTNVAYRREFFFSHRGFADHTTLLIGATDIMVNHHSTTENTRLCLHPDSLMEQEPPDSNSRWNQDRLFFMETRRHFRHYFLYRTKYAFHVLLTLLFTVSFICVMAFWIATNDITLIATCGTLWLIHTICRNILFIRAIRSLGEKDTFILTLPLFLNLVPCWDISAWLHWLITPKRTFMKKFI